MCKSERRVEKEEKRVERETRRRTTAGMFSQKLGHVVNVSMKHNPHARGLGVVLLHLL